MSKGKTNAGTGGGTGKSEIIVTAPTGSTVYIENQDGKRKDAVEKNGVWTFKGCDIGTWTLHASLGDQTAAQTVVIQEEDQLMRYLVNIGYQLYASDFKFYKSKSLTTPAVLGTDYEIVYDDDSDIPENLWTTTKNWKVRNLVTLYCVPLRDGIIDVFCVGGGGSGTSSFGSGGGGGYTTTETVEVKAGEAIKITIGAGGQGVYDGEPANDGGTTSAFGVVANGGGSSPRENGGPGGSGGGAADASGGSDGGDGHDYAPDGYVGGKGQNTTTREFGDPNGKLYAGGGAGQQYRAGSDPQPGAGGGGKANGGNGTPNSGGGGSGTTGGKSGNGATGIVVFRNARGVAA